MINGQLPALQVVVPLIAAALCLILSRLPAAWLITFAASAVSMLVSFLMLKEVLQSGVIDYAFGGWAAPFGIAYRVDIVNAYVLMIVSTISTVISVFARVSVASEIEAYNQGFFYTAWLLCLTGLLGIAITGDAFNLFVFLEISALASYVLIAMGADRRALTAAYQYLIMGTIGATFILIGVGLLYALTGTLNMLDLAVRRPEVADRRPPRPRDRQRHRPALGRLAPAVGTTITEARCWCCPPTKLCSPSSRVRRSRITTQTTGRTQCSGAASTVAGRGVLSRSSTPRTTAPRRAASGRPRAPSQRRSIPPQASSGQWSGGMRVRFS